MTTKRYFHYSNWQFEIQLRWTMAITMALGCVLSAASSAEAQVTHPFIGSVGACTSSDGIAITCSGDISNGIKVFGTGEGAMFDTIVVTDVIGSISAANRNDRDGIGFDTIDGNIRLEMVAEDAFNIKTLGPLADGIEFRHQSESSTGTIDVTYFGNIETKGTFSSGIRLYGGDAEIQLYHVGDIVTKSSSSSIASIENDSSAIYVRQTSGSNSVKIENYGNMSTQSGVGFGANILTYVNGDVTLIQRGNITTNYDQSSYAPMGIRVVSGYGRALDSSLDVSGDITIDFKGAINTYGQNSYGILAWAGFFFGDANLDINFVGNIHTVGSRVCGHSS